MIEYSIDLASSTIHARLIGKVGRDEVADYLQRLLREPALPRGLREVVDMSDCEEFALEFEDARQLAHLFGAVEIEKGLACSFVLAPMDAEYGTARMLGALVEQRGIEVRVCRTRAELEAAMLRDCRKSDTPPPLNRENSVGR